MAIDTTEKKLSLIGFGRSHRLTLPFADGSLDQGDRQHLIGLYAGILAGAVAVSQPDFVWQLGARKTRWQLGTRKTVFEIAPRR